MTPTLDRPDRPRETTRASIIETPTVVELARRCHAEGLRYQNREPYDEGPGHELFHRAVVARDDAAWAAIYAQYAGRVRRWLDLREEDDDAVTAVFERFWHAVDAEKFALFTSLAAILSYLKTCAASVRADRARAARASGALEPLDESVHALPARQNVEEAVVGSADVAALWAAVRAALDDEREREIVYLSYVAGLSPRQIYARRRARFSDVDEVYRLKRNVLSRLRRSTRLRTLVASS